MTYQEFIKNINFGDTTAFVYDAPNNRYNYASGEIYDGVFDNVTTDTNFSIVGINELPQVKEAIVENFLAELEPAPGVEDEGYEAVKAALESGSARIGYWDNETKYGPDTFTTTTYMLILD